MARAPRPCIGPNGGRCPYGQLAYDGATRCHQCGAATNAKRNATRTHYHGTYRARAKAVREAATVCWLCGGGPRPHDPWTADHVTPGDPDSVLLPAHRTCNSARGNR